MKEKLISSLSEIRDTSGITYEVLSQKTGIDRSNLIKIFSGKANPTINTLSKIAKALNVELILNKIR